MCGNLIEKAGGREHREQHQKKITLPCRFDAPSFKNGEEKIVERCKAEPALD
jgi:hypothetical protein